LFADYALAATPALNTIVAGSPAAYTVIVTPSNSFNQQVNLSCANLPPGASCAFDHSSVTPSGSGVSVSLTVRTVKTLVALTVWRNPFGSGPSARWLWILCAAAIGSLVALRRRQTMRLLVPHQLLLGWAKLVALGVLLALAALAGSCRNVGVAGGTTTGNYTITISGTLNSNTTVVRSTTVNLSVT
jgi:hypothetical protein